MEQEKKTKKLTATQVILLGFLAAILLGSVLLCLPVMSASGRWTPYLDALFTATTSVCVTGLTSVDTFSYWSTLGHVVILVLIQLGGLGIISFTTGFMVLIRRRISLKNRMLLESAFNLETLSGLVKFLGKVFKGTLAVEGAGALLCLPVFVPEYGARGVWLSIFHAVSAFCNAGIDLIGPNSLIPYATNVWLNLVTMALIVMGGLGFIVWWDVLDVAGQRRRGELRRGQCWRKLHIHTRVTLVTTAVLLLGGWVLFLILEWSNPETLGQYGVGGRVLCALFQSVTTRTAGFATIPQSGLRGGSILLSVVLMFIGGSSVGTAGGVKTSTVALVFLSAAAVVRGRDNVCVGRRTIPAKLVQRASAVVAISLAFLLSCTLLLGLFESFSFDKLLYETASALGTAGLTCGVTAASGTAGRLLLICCMYFGRVGPISLATALAYRREKGPVYPEENITIG